MNCLVMTFVIDVSNLIHNYNEFHYKAQVTSVIILNTTSNIKGLVIEK